MCLGDLSIYFSHFKFYSKRRRLINHILSAVLYSNAQYAASAVFLPIFHPRQISQFRLTNTVCGIQSLLDASFCSQHTAEQKYTMTVNAASTRVSLPSTSCNCILTHSNTLTATYTPYRLKCQSGTHSVPMRAYQYPQFTSCFGACERSNQLSQKVIRTNNNYGAFNVST